ncbi:MAG: metal ABC transporter permease [Candidatus Wallbacteria bacterium]|nr:metal ABC transporter permease [Candidatus Wallbacteria bacterium]
MESWHALIAKLPFEWAHYRFMADALLAVLICCPLFSLIGTMVVSNHLVFFSDVLGHSALTGIAIGVLMGLGDPQWAMVGFAIMLAIGVNAVKKYTSAAPDTVLGVFFSAITALGIVILSRGGGFAKYTSFLIGDILAVGPVEIVRLCFALLLVLLLWYIGGNALLLVSVSPSLARSRGRNVFLIETIFSMLLAVVVTISIRLVGILIINSLLVLPAAAARNLARDTRAYTAWALLLSLISGVSGLIASYYWGTASGPTIVLFAAFLYAVTAVLRPQFRKN